MKNEITEVQVLPIKPREGLVAFASLILNGSLCLTSIGIHQKLDGNGYRLTYPTKLVGDRTMNLYHPITKDLSKAVEEAILNKFKEVMNKNHDRYSCFNNT